jgi:hypothetical protein
MQRLTVDKVDDLIADLKDAIKQVKVSPSGNGTMVRLYGEWTLSDIGSFSMAVFGFCFHFHFLGVAGVHLSYRPLHSIPSSSEGMECKSVGAVSVRVIEMNDVSMYHLFSVSRPLDLPFLSFFFC